jgi:hypothetical protein
VKESGIYYVLGYIFLWDFLICSGIWSLLVQISKEHGGIVRFIQVSCLGSSPSSQSRFLRAKAAAEEAILRELPEVILIFFSKAKLIMPLYVSLYMNYMIRIWLL